MDESICREMVRWGRQRAESFDLDVRAVHYNVSAPSQVGFQSFHDRVGFIF